jgi:hypothetical protein
VESRIIHLKIGCGCMSSGVGAFDVHLKGASNGISSQRYLPPVVSTKQCPARLVTSVRVVRIVTRSEPSGPATSPERRTILPVHRRILLKRGKNGVRACECCSQDSELGWLLMIGRRAGEQRVPHCGNDDSADDEAGNLY